MTDMWDNLFDKACEIADTSKAAAIRVDPCRDDPNIFDIWYRWKTGAYMFRLFDPDVKSDIIADIASDSRVKIACLWDDPISPQTKDGDWCCIQTRAGLLKCAEKQNMRWSNPLHVVGGLTGFHDGIARFPGFPSPLAATIGGGLLGSGLGYVGGRVANLFGFGNSDTARKWAVRGALAGVVPGATHSYGAWRSGNSLIDGRNYMRYSRGIERPKLPETPSKPEPVDVDLNTMQRLDDLQKHSALKIAAFNSGMSTDGRPIPLTDFNKNLWRDPFLHPKDKAALSSVLNTASTINRGNPWVTPLMVGATTMAMGGSFRDGVIAGGTLGVLSNLPGVTQQDLQTAGIWAGVARGVLPTLFGKR